MALLLNSLSNEFSRRVRFSSAGRRGIEPLIAVVILTSIAITLAVAISLWFLGVVGQSGYGTRYVRVVIYGDLRVRDNNLWFLVKNEGGDPVFVDDVVLDGKHRVIPIVVKDEVTGEDTLEFDENGCPSGFTLKPGRRYMVYGVTDFTLKPATDHQLKIHVATGHEFYKVLRAQYRVPVASISLTPSFSIDDLDSLSSWSYGVNGVATIEVSSAPTAPPSPSAASTASALHMAVTSPAASNVSAWAWRAVNISTSELVTCNIKVESFSSDSIIGLHLGVDTDLDGDVDKEYLYYWSNSSVTPGDLPWPSHIYFDDVASITGAFRVGLLGALPQGPSGWCIFAANWSKDFSITNGFIVKLGVSVIRGSCDVYWDAVGSLDTHGGLTAVWDAGNPDNLNVYWFVGGGSARLYVTATNESSHGPGVRVLRKFNPMSFEEGFVVRAQVIGVKLTSGALLLCSSSLGNAMAIDVQSRAWGGAMAGWDSSDPGWSWEQEQLYSATSEGQLYNLEIHVSRTPYRVAFFLYDEEWSLLGYKIVEGSELEYSYSQLGFFGFQGWTSNNGPLFDYFFSSVTLTDM